MKIVIAGFGSVGTSLYQKLKNDENELVLIDRDPKAFEKIPARDREHTQTLKLDISDYDQLGASLFRDCDIFYAATSSDEKNIITCKFAKENGAQKTICRSANIGLDKAQIRQKKNFMGIDVMVNLDEIVAQEFYRLVQAPNNIVRHPIFDGTSYLMGFRIAEISAVCGKPVSEVRRELAGKSFQPAALEKGSVTHLDFADENLLIEEKDYLYFFCDRENVQNLRKFLGYKRENEKNIFIYGHSRAGELLAKMSEDRYRVKYAEPDPALCDSLSQKLRKTIVLDFDGVDEKKMLEEEFNESHYFFSVGNDFAKNVCSCVLATHHQVKYTFCISPQKEYIPICEADSLLFLMLCPNLIMADYLYRFAHIEKISGYFSFRDNHTEMFDFEVQSISGKARMKIDDIGLPGGVKIAFVRRNGNLSVPNGRDTLNKGDRVVLLTHAFDRAKALSHFFEEYSDKPQNPAERQPV